MLLECHSFVYNTDVPQNCILLTEGNTDFSGIMPIYVRSNGATNTGHFLNKWSPVLFVSPVV